MTLGDNSSATFGVSTALGYKAEALNDSGTALGSGASVTASWSVALGAYSNATEISVVSVGSNKGIIPETRKIVNVTDSNPPPRCSD